MNGIYKVLPLLLGGLTGWALTHPPDWLQGMGAMAWWVHGSLCFLLLISVVALMILAALPERLTMKPLPEGPLHAELAEMAERLEAIGFRRAGPSRMVLLFPAATLVAFVHESEPVYATVFRTGTVPAKSSFDFVSVLHDDRGGLTTGTNPAGVVLPEGSGSLRQVFPESSMEKTFLKHREGIAWLQERGLVVRNVSDSTFEGDFIKAIAYQRSIFLAAPVRGTLITLWRAATRQIPFVGPLRDQRVAQRQVARLLAG